jgi:hypothetical protein
MTHLRSSDTVLPVWVASEWPPAAAQPRRATERRINFVPMTEADLDAVCEVEKSAYTHPWSRKHFADSLTAGYPAVMLLGEVLHWQDWTAVALVMLAIATVLWPQKQT